MIIINNKELSQHLLKMSNEEIVTVDQAKALKKLDKLKVSDVMIRDEFYQGEYKCYFDSMWWSTLREFDLFKENQESELTKVSAKSTEKWLKDNQRLTIEYKDDNIL